jgi:hypothetical protein
MSIGKFRAANSSSNNNNNSSSLSTNLAGATEAVVDLYNKKVKVTKAKVRDVTRGLAEIAFNLGETNDEEEYASEMEEDIMLAIEEAVKRDAKRREKNKSS